MIVVLDYGMGNLRSVERAVQHLGFRCSVQQHLTGATKLIIPGVGAFGAAMEHIGPLAQEIRSFALSGQPLMGICLGQQLLFEVSEELGEHQGLGLIGGRVRYFPKDLGLKVPHIGWNEVDFKPGEPVFKSSDESKAKEAEQYYFVHSLYTDCSDPEDVAATTEYGIRFASAVRRDNIFATQFHPEKSGDAGLDLLKGFLAW